MSTSKKAVSAAGSLEERVKRLRIRSWRRGTKEMDLILGGFVDRYANALSESDVDQLEAIVIENDHDLYRWVAGTEETPSRHTDIIIRLRNARL